MAFITYKYGDWYKIYLFISWHLPGFLFSHRSSWRFGLLGYNDTSRGNQTTTFRRNLLPSHSKIYKSWEYSFSSSRINKSFQDLINKSFQDLINLINKSFQDLINKSFQGLINKSFHDLINKSFHDLLILEVEGSRFIANVGIRLPHSVASNLGEREFSSTRNFSEQAKAFLF